MGCKGKQRKSFITYEYLFISYEHLFISYEYLFISYERLLLWKKGKSGGEVGEKVKVEGAYRTPIRVILYSTVSSMRSILP